MEAKGLNTSSRRFLVAEKHVLPWMSIIQHRTNENPFSRRREWQFVCLKGLEEAHCETCEMKHTCSNKWLIFNWLSRQDITCRDKNCRSCVFFRSRGSLSGSDEILCDIHESDHRSITIGTSHVYRDGGKLSLVSVRKYRFNKSCNFKVSMNRHEKRL